MLRPAIIFQSAIFALLPLAPHKVDAQSFASQICETPGHFDVFVDVDPPASDAATILVDTRGDFPTDPSTGAVIVPANFEGDADQRNKTDDPGWVVEPGDMLGPSDLGGEIGEFLWFRALAPLRYWDPDLDVWLEQPPAGERVRFGGAIPFGISGTPEEIAFYEGGTIWSGGAIQGPLEAPIEMADGSPGGAEIHAHLDFCVEDITGDCTTRFDQTGNPSAGGYLIEFELFSDAATVGPSGTQQKYRKSRPIKILLSNGLSPEDCDAAVNALVNPKRVLDNSAPLPAAGVLIMTGP